MTVAVMAGAGGAYRPVKVAPLAGTPHLPVYLYRIISNAVAAIPEAAYTDAMVRIRRPGGEIVYVCAPELVEGVLRAAPDTFPKSPPVLKMLKPALGNGLLTASGESWRAQRRTAAPIFRHGRLLEMLPKMTAPFDELAGNWRKLPPGSIVDAQREMTAATYDVLRDTVFGGDRAIEVASITGAIDSYRGGVAWAMVYELLGLPDWMPRPRRRRMLAAARQAREAGRRYVGVLDADHPDNLIAALAAARDPETGDALDAEHLVDNLLSFIIAGHETVATVLTWCAHLLAEQPGLQDMLIAEVDETLGGDPVRGEHLAALKHTDRFIKETMRLFPPVGVLGRVAREAVRIGGQHIAGGTVLVVPVYAIHRHDSLWDEPDRFDPSRFAGSAEAGRHRAAYLPFGAGPRICIGAGLSMIELVAGLATLLRHTRFRPVAGVRPEPVHFTTLRPRGGLPVRVEPREDRE